MGLKPLCRALLPTEARTPNHDRSAPGLGTLVYVKALALPEVLLELEAVAAKAD